MASYVKSFFKNLVNTPQNPAERFAEIWREIRDAHAEILSQRRLDEEGVLETSRIPQNLREMLKILLEEQNLDLSARAGHVSTGPCIEYMLNHRVVEAICMFGLANDRPRGIMALVLQTVYAIMKHLDRAILPHMSVHMPVSQLIYVCNAIVRDFASEKRAQTINEKKIQLALVALIHTIWQRIDGDEGLLDFFYNDEEMIKLRSPQKAKRQEEEDSSTPPSSPKTNKFVTPRLTLVTALIPYIHVRARIGDYAREAILIIMGLKVSRLHEFVVRHTKFRERLVQGLSRSFLALPRRVEACHSALRFSAHDEKVKKRGGIARPEDILALSQFTDRLCFVDDVLQVLSVHCRGEKKKKENEGKQQEGEMGGSKTYKQICFDLTRNFFLGVIRPMLLNTNEETAEVGALYVRFIIDTLWKDRIVGAEKSGRVLLYDRKDGMGSGLRRISPILQILVEFVVGSSSTNTTTTTTIALDEETARVEEESLNLRTALIERVNSVSSTLSLASLGLFGSLLDLNVPHVSNVLISSYFKSHQISTSPITYFLSHHEKMKDEEDLDAPITLGVAATRFLDLFQGTSWPSASEKSLSTYLYDAQSRSVAVQCLGTFGWIAVDSTITDNVKNVNTNASKIEEGPFLESVFDKLENFLNLTMDEALEVTNVVSKLALCTNRDIFCRFFACDDDGDDDNDSKPTKRSLITILRRVWNDAKTRKNRIKDFSERLREVRVELGIIEKDVEDEVIVEEEGKEELVDWDVERRKFVIAYAVLIELLKEIAAILQATEWLVNAERRQATWLKKSSNSDSQEDGGSSDGTTRGRLSSDSRFAL